MYKEVMDERVKQVHRVLNLLLYLYVVFIYCIIKRLTLL